MAAVAASEQSTKRAKPSGALEQYAEAVADAIEDLWQGRASATQLQLLDDKVIWHDSLLPREDLVGLEQLQELVGLFRGALPDLSLALQRQLHTGEDGVVLGYWRASGTQTGALGPSLPPTGAKASWEGSLVIRTAVQSPADAEESSGGSEGQSRSPPHRGVEVWWSWDPIFLFRQLGWKEQPPAAAESNGATTEGAVAGAAVDDLAARTAAAARSAFATEAEAAAAAAAAVAAAAAAAERLAESPEALAAAQEANRRVVELYFHTYNTGNYAVLDHIVHPDYQYDGLLDLGGKRGRAAMAAMMGGWRDCLPDLAIGHELFVAMGADKVTFRWVIRGTHSTPGSKLLGVSANGSRLQVCGVTTLTLREGRIARKISHANAAATLQQLGAAAHPTLAITLPSAAAATKAATAAAAAATAPAPPAVTS